MAEFAKARKVDVTGSMRSGPIPAKIHIAGRQGPRSPSGPVADRQGVGHLVEHRGLRCPRGVILAQSRSLAHVSTCGQ
jgi:hypothetical protein